MSDIAPADGHGQAIRPVEWPTLCIAAMTYLVWALATSLLWGPSPLLSVLVTGLAITQFSSLQHEVLHGHPFPDRRLNEALVFPSLTLTVPFGRFRDTHLAHHYDPNLTDPYDDPESNFVDPSLWPGMNGAVRVLLMANNTLLGRIILGPVIGNYFWLRSEAALLRKGARGVWRDWMLNTAGLVPVVAWLWLAAMPWWAYLLAAWLGHGLLKIRTFLEHRVHEAARGRSVVVEDRGPLALLFLNNNYHSVHHSHPHVAWYLLPALFRDKRAHFLARNDGYYFRSYAPIFRNFLLRRKDPVPHPLWPVARGQDDPDQTMRRNVGTGPALSKNGTPG